MQEQNPLKHLGKARLSLFQSFCLPTILHQTTQNFLWIIKTDPDLPISLREEMIKLLKNNENYFLVGSNHNYLIGHEDGAWRGGIEGEDVLLSDIYTGNIDLLCQAYEAQEESIVLQTRLDADDGLHSSYMETIQQQALRKFKSESSENDKLNWMYWCTMRHIEWFADHKVQEGKVDFVLHEKLCVTPGITLGISPFISEKTVPNYAHDKLYKSLVKEGGCGHVNPKECITVLTDFFGAVRTRTPTSAGMLDINKSITKSHKVLEKLWNELTRSFKIQIQKAQETNQYIFYHLQPIVMDNLKGQCTHGHSCKLSSKEELLRIVDLVSEGARGYLIKQEDHL